MTPLEAAEQALRACGLEKGRLLCAVSGGADSVALLRALVLLQSRSGFALEAAHVQHGLRGADSLADEELVRQLCARWNVPLHVENAGLTGTMEDAGMETLARQRRREIFARLMRLRGMDALLTAHHRDDQAETMLMHLLRGAGMEGLCGMRLCAPFGGGVQLRPFLALSKAELVDWLAEQEIPYRQDASNQQAVTPRNALRLQVMPKLEALFPGAARHVAQTARSLSVDEAFLSGQANALYNRCLLRGPGVFALDKAVLRQAEPALVRRCLRRWWAEGVETCGGLPQERSLSYDDTLALEGLLRGPGGATQNLPGGLMAAAGRDYLHLTAQTGEALLPLPMENGVPVCKEQTQYRLPWGVFRAEAYQGPSPRQADWAVLSEAVLERHPALRLPRPGDVIHPLGAPGSKPLRRYLTDRQVDRPLRQALPVLAVDSRILWIPGLCTAEELRQPAQCAGLRLSLTQEIPFLSHYTKE